MKFIQFISHFEDIHPKYKDALITGIRWGIWLGGLAVLIAFLLLKLLNLIP